MLIKTIWRFDYIYGLLIIYLLIILFRDNMSERNQTNTRRRPRSRNERNIPQPTQ